MCYNIRMCVVPQFYEKRLNFMVVLNKICPKMGYTNGEHFHEIKNKLRSFKSSEHINEKGDGPYHGFGNLFSESVTL